MTMRERQRVVQLYRGQVPSPGRPTVAWRQDRVRFWAAIAGGASSEDAALEIGVSSAVGVRWFRHAGGVNPNLGPSVSGRYLSFTEREDIAVWHAQKLGVREIARRLGRAPSTISRELRRNASTRTWRLEYRASTAQWHAERRRARAPGRRDPIWRRNPSGPRCALEGSQQAAPSGPTVGAVVEPRTDRRPVTGRLRP